MENRTTAPAKPAKKKAKAKVDNTLKSKQARTLIKKKAMIEAMRKHMGVVALACKAVDISRETHYDWLKTDSAYRESVETIKEETLDFAESKLLQKINSGDTVSILFYLKTQGKKRGYIEKQEVDVTEKTIIVETVNSFKIHLGFVAKYFKIITNRTSIMNMIVNMIIFHSPLS